MRLFSTSFLTLSLSAVTMAATVKNLVVFGDSNSDVGNGQRWSDGPLWSEFLAVGWNASLYSFAFSGSVCDNSIYNTIAEEDRVPSLRDQLEAYYNLNLNLNPEETVYAFWFGIQDVFEMAKRHGRQEPDYKEIIDCIGQQLRTARKVFLSDRFIVLNVPPFENMPYFAETEVAVNRSQAAVEINRGLEKNVANLNKHHHALEMDYVDIHSLINDIVVDPSVFSFQKPTVSYLDDCFQQKECKNTEKDYIWWDKTHFTSAFHQSVAKSILEAESYMPKVSLTKEIINQLNDRKSKFHSKKYSAPPSKGIVDEQAKLYDIKKSIPVQPQQPPLEDDREDYREPTVSNNRNHAYIGLLVFVLILIGIVAWIKFPNATLFGWFRSSSRGKFSPVRNEEA